MTVWFIRCARPTSGRRPLLRPGGNAGDVPDRESLARGAREPRAPAPPAIDAPSARRRAGEMPQLAASASPAGAGASARLLRKEGRFAPGGFVHLDCARPTSRPTTSWIVYFTSVD